MLGEGRVWRGGRKVDRGWRDSMSTQMQRGQPRLVGGIGQLRYDPVKILDNASIVSLDDVLASYYSASRFNPRPFLITLCRLHKFVLCVPRILLLLIKMIDMDKDICCLWLCKLMVVTHMSTNEYLGIHATFLTTADLVQANDSNIFYSVSIDESNNSYGIIENGILDFQSAGLFTDIAIQLLSCPAI